MAVPRCTPLPIALSGVPGDPSAPASLLTITMEITPLPDVTALNLPQMTPGGPCLYTARAESLNFSVQSLPGALDLPPLLPQLPAVLMPVQAALGINSGRGHERPSQNQRHKPTKIESSHRILLKLCCSCFCCLNP